MVTRRAQPQPSSHPRRSPPAARDSEKTRARILEALGAQLAKHGFQNTGVNSVARAAGVDKVLIYRYFGGMAELLRCYGRAGRFWPTIAELLGRVAQNGAHHIGRWGVAALVGHLRALRARPETQEIMRWELQQKNELTEELARLREQQGVELLALAPPAPPGLDLAAVAALLHAGITYLVLRSKTADVYLGLDLHSDRDWHRIESAIDLVVNAVASGSQATG